MENDSLKQGRIHTIKMMNPEWTEEQVQARLTEIERYCEQQESQDHWHNPILEKIWNKKQKRNR